MEDTHFVGKRALVTGGARGIGKAIVEALYKAGAELFVVGKSAENLQNLKYELPNVHLVQVDLENWESTRSAIENIGHVDLLVNNAGFGQAQTFLDVERDLFEKHININLKSAFNVSQVIAKSMISKGTGGAIVNISSYLSVKPRITSFSYCVSKAGLDMMTKVMALELGPHKIRVNSINPTFIPTDMTKEFFAIPALTTPILERIPLGKFGTVDEVANTTMFLLSDKAEMITGATLFVDGGVSIS